MLITNGKQESEEGQPESANEPWAGRGWGDTGNPGKAHADAWRDRELRARGAHLSERPAEVRAERHPPPRFPLGAGAPTGLPGPESAGPLDGSGLGERGGPRGVPGAEKMLRMEPEL